MSLSGLRVAVIVFPGSNCDRDMMVAIEQLAGRRPSLVWHKETTLDPVDLAIIPGGFSYGDYLRCGALAARAPIMESVLDHAARGGAVMGICNGFQILLETGLLPGVLVENAGLKYVCRNTSVEVVEGTASPFTEGLSPGQRMIIPVAHNEGNYFASDDDLQRLEDNGQVAFRYTESDIIGPANPNGAARNIAGPGGDAGLIRIHGTNRGLAASTDCTPRYVEADPHTGGAQAVAEAWRNLSAIGARGLAITNNLNFGNPEKPDIMAQMAQSVLGMGDAARALDTPVVSGNVSLYNETDGNAILPCPVVGMVGTIDDIDKAVGNGLPHAGLSLVVIGQGQTCDDGWLGVSLYARMLADGPDAAPPPVDLDAEHRHGLFVQSLIADGHVVAAHDISDGGLAVALAEMCIAGRTGASITSPASGNLHGWAFGEDQGRYILAVKDGDAVMAAAAAQGLPASLIGTSIDSGELQFGGSDVISVEEMEHLVETTIPALMSGTGHTEG